MTSAPRTYLRWTLALLAFLGAAFFASVIFAPEVWARVGGGGSYGGGSRGGGGSGGGGGGGGELVRLLLYLTIKYPAIGIPLDILVISLLIYRWTRPRKKGTEVYSSSVTGSAPGGFGSDERQRRVTQQFDQLRRFDPNFSEIIFADFGYALYGRAHHARGQNPATLNLLSPYLSDAARNALLQRNPPNLQSVIGIIVGAMEVVNVDGLATPWVRISLEFEANYTEVVSTDKQDQGAGRQMSYYVRERWDLSVSATCSHRRPNRRRRCIVPVAARRWNRTPWVLAGSVERRSIAASFNGTSAQ